MAAFLAALALTLAARVVAVGCVALASALGCVALTGALGVATVALVAGGVVGVGAFLAAFFTVALAVGALAAGLFMMRAGLAMGLPLVAIGVLGSGSWSTLAMGVSTSSMESTFWPSS